MKLSKSKKRWLFGLMLLGALFYVCFPNQLFNVPYSTILNDENGKLLSARIASDGQWRFPMIQQVPEELENCILYFEDEYFYYHPGVNPISIARALWQNISSGSIKSGGSTLSMQVIRMSRRNPDRNYVEKILEMYLAFRMEFSYSKEDIINLYVSHAPYGGNVVGVEAAAWRYFNRPLSQLSWAEYATLAVLPNAPTLIRPGKNSSTLREKRDRLLHKLLVHEVLDTSTYELALLEEIPSEPHALPALAQHLLDKARSEGKSGTAITSTLNLSLQQKVTTKVNTYIKHLQANKIHNACALVISLEDGEIKAYVGNASIAGVQSPYVDLIQAKRSSGSILKPFLYAAAVEEGLIHTSTLLSDVPKSYNGFSPYNFHRQFDGVVPAEKALARSLNVPAVSLLQEYGLGGFYKQLQDLGFSSINRSVDNYGLTLILGGAEISVWDVAQAYAAQAMRLGNTKELPNIYAWNNEVANAKPLTYSQGGWWLISEALQEVQRPGLEQSWKRYSSSRQVAWKTGTSFGFRDAWAVGYDAKYLVAVWVGNANGEGRPGLTGTSVAAPLMFEVFQLLTERSWFEKPYADLKNVKLCSVSGLAPTPNCPQISQEIPIKGKVPAPCTYHQKIHLNSKGQRVLKSCANQNEMHDTNWFVLDPVSAFYYKRNHISYANPPPFAPTCGQGQSLVNPTAILYPVDGAEIIVPKSFEGEYESLIAEAAHFNKQTLLYWHVDDQFIGTTKGVHKQPLHLSIGAHQLSIIDELGNKASIRFTVYRKG